MQEIEVSFVVLVDPSCWCEFVIMTHARESLYSSLQTAIRTIVIMLVVVVFMLEACFYMPNM